jgi:hypothetical protein
MFQCSGRNFVALQLEVVTELNRASGKGAADLSRHTNLITDMIKVGDLGMACMRVDLLPTLLLRRLLVALTALTVQRCGVVCRATDASVVVS